MDDLRLSGMPDTFHVFSWPPANADIKVARNIDWPGLLLLLETSANAIFLSIQCLWGSKQWTCGEIGDFRGPGPGMVIWATLGAPETAGGANKPPNAPSFMRPDFPTAVKSYICPIQLNPLNRLLIVGSATERGLMLLSAPESA